MPAEASPKPMSPRQIYKQHAKSVVLVFATDGSAQGSAGTGSLISADGQIITNAHVVMKNGRPYRRLFVYTKPKKLTGSMNRDLKHRHEVILLDSDRKLDLALLRMKKPPRDLQPIEFADPDNVEIGEPVVAVGMPETGGLWTLTTGSISSVIANFNNVRGKDVFQTEASGNRGNSGGPLLNVFGQMVGINTSISRRAADGLAITDINFSLKSSVAVD
ncbi:MAG: serine protease, partial [Myxococcota bacterium]